MATRHLDRRFHCDTGVRVLHVHRKLPSAHSSMCVLKAALCVHAACVEVARGVYSSSLVFCLWRCDWRDRRRKMIFRFSLSRTRLMSCYHVKSFIPSIRKSSRRAASMRPTQNVEPHQACTATSYIPQQRGATRRVPITRMMTNTSAARATRCARSVRTPPDRRRPRGSMQTAACHYQARARGPARPH